MEMYRVVVTTDAEQDVDRCYQYIVDTFKSLKTADAFLDDFYEVKEKLRLVAGKLQSSQHALLKDRNVRRCNFARHDYFVLYTLEENVAIIIAVGHFRQDIQNVLK